jgi:hypothetical protein
MVAATTSWWKPVRFLLLGNFLYFSTLWLGRDTRAVQVIEHGLPFVYFVLPAILCLVGLYFSGLLSLRADPLRTIFLVAWSIVLPVLTFTSMIFGGMYACHLGLIPNCLPH